MMAEEERVQVINPPNVIKSKVVEGGPGAVDTETLKRAETVIAEETDNYLEFAKADLTKIQAGLVKLKANRDKPESGLEIIFNHTHNIKGQAGSFGYGLLTTIADRLCRIIENLDGIKPKQIQVIELCVLAMHLTIIQDMTGDGGKDGAALIQGLDLVIAKFFPSH